MEQQQGHKLAHNIGPPQHYAPLPGGVDAVLPEHLHHAAGGAWLEHRGANGKLSHIIGVKAVHILGRING